MAEPFPYATLDDLKARWPSYPGPDSMAELLLEDASVMVDAECPGHDADPAVLRIVVVDMVKAVMTIPDYSAGLSSAGMTAGPFSQQLSFRSDDLFVTKKHKRLLGCGGQRPFSIDLLADPNVP